MRELRPATKGYLFILVLVTGGLLSTTLVRAGLPTGRDGPLSLLLLGLTVGVVAFPLPIGPQQKLTLSSSSIFATVLLLAPGPSMLVMGLGTLLGQGVRRQPWDQTLFNTVQIMLQTAGAGLFLAAVGWRLDHLASQPALFLALAGAALVIEGLNTGLVAVIVALESHQPVARVARVAQGIFYEVPLLSVAQYALGFLTAMSLGDHLWTVMLFVVLAYPLYRASEYHSQLREQARHLEHRAFHDALTGLPNRALFLERLEQAMARTARQQRRVAVLFLDLDGFKRINDTFGHAVGDELLVAVGQRLQTCLRLEDTLARLGGDEFTVLIEDVTALDALQHLAERMTHELRQPMQIADTSIVVTTSIGIALSTVNTYAAADLLTQADLALYRAKATGRDTFVVADQQPPCGTDDRWLAPWSDRSDSDWEAACGEDHFIIEEHAIHDVDDPLGRTSETCERMMACQQLGWGRREDRPAPSPVILVVEDDLVIADMVQQVLHGGGYQTIHVTDGKLAVESVERMLPDLILMDLMLPVMNGIDACRAIKASQCDEVAQIPIVAMADGRHLDRATDAFCVDGFIAKPVERTALLIIVSEHLQTPTLEPAP